MKDYQYDEIIFFLKEWVIGEGLCRFCDKGRLCPKSRRGRQECPSYLHTPEMDCFHHWIKFFDKEDNFWYARSGYEHRDSYPWMNEGPEADTPPGAMFSPQSDEELSKKAKIHQLDYKKNHLMQKISDLNEESEDVQKQLNELEPNE